MHKIFINNYAPLLYKLADGARATIARRFLNIHKPCIIMNAYLEFCFA